MRYIKTPKCSSFSQLIILSLVSQGKLHAIFIGTRGELLLL